MHDYVTNTAAGFAVLSPWWLPWLEDFSTLAALLLPIIGVAWLAIQIWSKVYRNK